MPEPVCFRSSSCPAFGRKGQGRLPENPMQAGKQQANIFSGSLKYEKAT
ncbi:hypothetical protein [Eikenella corrodens]|nr:hypothetical protein [Eikenella corrodens]